MALLYVYTTFQVYKYMYVCTPTIIIRKKSLSLIMQPHSHGNHGFPFGINGYYVGGIAGLQQSQHPEHNEQQQLQYHQPQNQQLWHGHVVPFFNPHVQASSILSYPSFDSLFEKQVMETNQFINNQVNIYMYHNLLILILLKHTLLCLFY